MLVFKSRVKDVKIKGALVWTNEENSKTYLVSSKYKLCISLKVILRISLMQELCQYKMCVHVKLTSLLAFLTAFFLQFGPTFLKKFVADR